MLISFEDEEEDEEEVCSRRLIHRRCTFREYLPRRTQNGNLSNFLTNTFFSLLAAFGHVLRQSYR